MATFIQSFPYTGVDQTFTVSAGVNSIKIQAWGAGGGGGGNSGSRNLPQYSNGGSGGSTSN